MVVDSSALLAMFLDEPEHAHFRRTISRADTKIASAATLLEASMVVLGRFGMSGINELQAFLRVTEIASVPFDQAQGTIALEAFRRFGKGRHRAALNFGDCISYALARTTSEPLLFKGDDFVHTDIISAA